VVLNEHRISRKNEKKALAKLSIDEKIRVMGSIMDTIMKIKVNMIKKRYNMTEQEAIRFLREKLIELQRY